MTPKTIKTARTVCQVVFFLLLAVFLTGTFCSVRLVGSAYLTCSLGMLQLTLGSGQIIAGTVVSGLLLLAVTVLLGRVFCGWVCPFGALLDWLAKPLAKFRTYRSKLPPALGINGNRGVKYGVLGGVLAAAGILKYPAFCTVCPVGTTCRTAGLQGVNMGLETAVLPLVAGMETMGKRYWCKVLCPIGALLGLFSRFSLLKIRLPWQQCTGCNRCEQACAMENSPHHSGHDRLKTDPAVLKALIEHGVPDLLDRPGKFAAYPAPVKAMLESRVKKVTVAPAECTRCFACQAACPVMNQAASPAAVSSSNKSVSV